MEEIRNGLHEAECLLNDRIPKKFRGKALKAVTAAADLIEKQQQQIEELQERIANMTDQKLVRCSDCRIAKEFEPFKGCRYYFCPEMSYKQNGIVCFFKEDFYCGNGEKKTGTKAMPKDTETIEAELDEMYKKLVVSWLYELALNNTDYHKKVCAIDLIKDIIERVEFGLKNYFKDKRSEINAE